MTDKVIFLLSGTSWTVPSDWNNAANTIEMIDGGGATHADGDYSTGGQGGAYRKYVNVALTKGASASYSVGAGSAYPSTSLGGATTHTGCSTPTLSYTGGVGATSAFIGNCKGGAAAGPYGDGQAAYVSGEDVVPGSGSLAWTSTHNASGGVSAATAGPGGGGGSFGNNGAVYGGGGGPYDSESGIGGNGADGIIVVTYTPQPAITGTLSATEARDTFAGSGAVVTPATGTLAATEARDTFAASGTVANAVVTGTLAATEAADAFAASGSVVTGLGGILAATEASDAFAGQGSVLDAITSGAGGGGGASGSPADWEYMRQVRIRRAARQKVADLAAPEIIDPAEEARKAAAAEKVRFERQAKLKEEMRLDAVKDTERQEKARARAEKMELEARQAEAQAMLAALDPKAIEKEHRRQRQVAANHDHHREIGHKIHQVAGAYLQHLATTPGKK